MPEKESVIKEFRDIEARSDYKNAERVNSAIKATEPLVSASLDEIISPDWDRICVSADLYEGIKKTAKGKILDIVTFSPEENDELAQRLKAAPCYSLEVTSYLHENQAIVAESQWDLLKVVANRLDCDDVKLIVEQDEEGEHVRALLTFPIQGENGHIIGFSHTLQSLYDTSIITDKTVTVQAEDLLITGIEQGNTQCLSLNSLTHGGFKFHHYDSHNDKTTEQHTNAVTYAHIGTKESSARFVRKSDDLSAMFHEVGHQIYSNSLEWDSLITKAAAKLSRPEDNNPLNGAQARKLVSIDERAAWNAENQLQFLSRIYLGVTISPAEYFVSMAGTQDWYLTTYDVANSVQDPLSGETPYFSTLARNLAPLVTALKQTGVDIVSFDYMTGDNLSVHPLFQLIAGRISPQLIANYSGLSESKKERLITSISKIYQALDEEV